MTRATIALVTIATLCVSARADFIILKRGGRLQVWGMPAQIGQGANAIDVTPDNAELYVDQSTGVIETEGYDVITARKTANAKPETFPLSEIVAVSYSTEPDDFATAVATMESGFPLQAIGDFRKVAENPAERETFRQQALFLIGVCYYNAGRRAECLKHYQAWKPVNSKYTPEVLSTVAQFLTEDRKFPEARAQYDEIPKLPGIPDAWKYKARLGAVRVDIAERKYDEAERMAQTVARETQSRADLADATVLAQVLQAEAIWKSGKTERLAEASTSLDRAAATEGASPPTRAYLLVTQGNLLYAQKKPDEARFPYMRAALMYPGSGHDGNGYLNAGTCFLDMSGKPGLDPAQSDTLFMSGMKLLGIAAASPYKIADAQKRYRENKSRYDALLAKESGGAGGAEPEGGDQGKPD